MPSVSPVALLFSLHVFALNFWKHLKVADKPLTPTHVGGCFPNNKGLLLITTVIKFRKFNIDTVLVCLSNSQPKFQLHGFPPTMSFIRTVSLVQDPVWNQALHLALTLVHSPLNQSSSGPSSVFHTLMCLTRADQLCGRRPLRVGFPGVFSWLKPGVLCRQRHLSQ